MAFTRFSNGGGFPNLEAVSVTSDGTNTTISFNPQQFVQVSTIGVSGSVQPVYLSTGVQATVANIESTGNGIYLFFYDRDTNRVQLIS